jgi:acyl-CoA thioester hydrolase
MIDLVVLYKAEVFYGEILTIELRLQEFTKYGCDFVYRIPNKEADTEVARAKTGVLIYDYERRKVIGVPEGFKSIVASGP